MLIAAAQVIVESDPATPWWQLLLGALVGSLVGGGAVLFGGRLDRADARTARGEERLAIWRAERDAAQRAAARDLLARIAGLVDTAARLAAAASGWRGAREALPPGVPRERLLADFGAAVNAHGAGIAPAFFATQLLSDDTLRVDVERLIVLMAELARGESLRTTGAPLPGMAEWDFTTGAEPVDDATAALNAEFRPLLEDVARRLGALARA